MATVYRRNSSELAHDIMTVAMQQAKASVEVAPWTAALRGVSNNEPSLTLEKLLEKYPARLHKHIRTEVRRERVIYARRTEKHARWQAERAEFVAKRKHELAVQHNIVGNPKLDQIYELACEWAVRPSFFSVSEATARKREQADFEKKFAALADLVR